MSATALECDLHCQVLSENCQIGGGCSGRVIWPCKATSAKDEGGASAVTTSAMVDGKIAAIELRHLNTHATEALPSSGGGQQGMSA
jgi:delta-aminolevulinic acid dehydratase/porphobilinogen synthase